MKLSIDYDITEFTADDAADPEHTRQLAINAGAAVYVGLLDLIDKELRLINLDKIAEARRWARFMHYCHTGRMV